MHGALASSVVASDIIRYKLLSDISISESNISKCYFEASFTHSITINYGAAILIPLHEILIHPCNILQMLFMDGKSAQNISGYGSTYCKSVDSDGIQCYFKT